MSALFFILFIMSAASVDGCSAPGAACLGALAALCLLAEKEGQEERKMAMGYKTCPYCGANLDPGEKCGCREEDAAPGQENDDEKIQNQHRHIYKKKEDTGNE